VRHTLTSLGYVMWIAAVIQLRVVRIQTYIHVMVLNHIDAVLCISNEFQWTYNGSRLVACTSQIRKWVGGCCQVCLV